MKIFCLKCGTIRTPVESSEVLGVGSTLTCAACLTVLEVAQVPMMDAAPSDQASPTGANPPAQLQPEDLKEEPGQQPERPVESILGEGTVEPGAPHVESPVESAGPPVEPEEPPVAPTA